MPIIYFQFYLLIALCANGFDDRVRVESGGDSEHVPGAVGVIGFAVGVDFEIRGNPREWVCHADGQGFQVKEEGVAVVEFLVIFACCIIRDVKVRGCDVHAGRVGRVRQVMIDEVANLPEAGVRCHCEPPFRATLAPGASAGERGRHGNPK